MKLKIQLYILSLWFLFGLLFINKVDIPICFGSDYKYIGTWNLIKINYIPLVCLAGMLYGCYSYWRFKNRVIDSSKQGPWQIMTIENMSFENLGFLATYIVPLLCFDLDFDLDKARNTLMLLLVLILIGAVYIKANLYYTNPSLALMNFRVYRITYQDQSMIKSAIVLSREKLLISDRVFAKHIDENVYYIQKSIL
jgi:hypothetical protein